MPAAIMNLSPLRPSLLDRRAASHNPAVPDHLSLSVLDPTPLPGPTNPPLRANARRPSAGILSFTPLTPIMASPTLTPEAPHASTSAAVLDTAARTIAPGYAISSTTPPAPAPPPAQPPGGDSNYVSHQPPFPPNPTWTTCPPTPPPKGSSLRLAPSTTPSPARAGDRGALTQRACPRRASESLASPQARPSASATCPSLSSTSTRAGAPSRTRASMRRMSLPGNLSKPLPPRPGRRADGTPKDLPPLPDALIDREQDEGGSLLPSLSRRAPMIRAASLSSRAALEGAGPAGREMGVGRGLGRKLFNLDADEGDASDEDEAEQHERGPYKEEKGPAREREQADLAYPDQDRDRDTDLERERERDREAEMGRARARAQQKERAERLRRYHALMELLTTEVGYLLDLRALVTVYLDQLLLLSAPPTPPTAAGPSSLAPPLPVGSQQCLDVSSHNRSMSTFSALSIPSIFPSSRSSFLQACPLPVPSISAPDCISNSSNSASECGCLQERERHTSCPPATVDSAPREREKETSSRRLTLRSSKSRTFSPLPLLSEQEVRAISRNAQELLKYHERFVNELRDTVSVTSFRAAFDQGSRERTQRADEVALEEVERAVELAAAKFLDEAAAFGIYEAFCPGHNAAGDIVRRVQERSPSAWDAYEQRCALLASNVFPGAHPDESKEDADLSPTSPTSELEDASTFESFSGFAKRRHSTPVGFPSSGSCTIEAAARSHLPFPTSSPSSGAVPLSTTERKVRWSGQKLKLTDYLIKPVQRICKYPLLLDQLRARRVARSASEDEDTPTDATWTDPTGDALRRATEAMREMISRVNRASEKEAHNLRSALIHSRLLFSNLPPQPGPTSSPTSPGSTSPESEYTSSSHGHSNSTSSCSAMSTAPTSPSSAGTPTPLPAVAPVPAPRAAHLTADFVASLGPCLLAGALDVVQHPVQRSKYLGAFLYAGGYCIFVKVPKGGRVYEPRHWFALSEVEVVDIEEDDPSYPYTFRVSGYGHHLQLAASCPQEKAIWMAAINDALSTKRAWAREPLSSLQLDKTPVAEDPLPDESSRRLSTIQSNSELEKECEMSIETVSTAPSATKLRYSKTMFRLDGIATKPEHYSQVPTFSAALSRRSSTASVKAFFAPIGFDSRIARPNLQIRGHVEGGLHDVFSESCLAVRAQAQMRGEELFQVRVPGTGRSRQQATVPRSSSGISLASMGFSAAKRKYDNVRRKSSVDLDMPAPPVPPLPGYAINTMPDSGGPTSSESGGLTFRSKTLAARRQRKPPGSIAPAISTAIAQMNADQQQDQPSGPLLQSPEPLSLDSPPDVSRCSSVSSALPSPVETSPLPIPTPGLSPNGTVRLPDHSPGPVRGREAMPKRSRSVVSNVRSLFHPPISLSRSTSSSSGRASPSPALPATDSSPSSSDSSNAIMQWFRRTSLRGRTSRSSSSANSLIDGCSDHGELRRPMPTRMSTDGVGMRTQFLDVPRSRGARDYSNHSSPKRHRSLFVSSTSRSRATFLDDTMRDKSSRVPSSLGAPATSDGSISAKRSLKRLLLFQRSTAMTPVVPSHTHSHSR